MEYIPTENGYLIIDQEKDLTVEVPSLREVAEYAREKSLVKQ